MTDISLINQEKSLMDSESCIEFFVLSFTHNFGLSNKQATGLLAQGCKYLAHITAKGLKGDFEPVKAWLQDIYVSNDKLSFLIYEELEEGSIQFALGALKPGILSKDAEVVQWTLRVLSRLILDLTDKQILNEVWKWYVDENLTEICVLSMKRNESEVKTHVIEFLLQIGQFSFIEFFTVLLRNVLSDNREYYECVCDILEHAKDSQSSLDDLADCGVISYWCEMAGKDSDFGYGRPRDCRVTGIIFLSKIVTVFLNYFESSETQMNSILGLLNRTCRDENKILKFLSIGVMFHLFDLLAEWKSSFAPVIYRTLTFLLVETYTVVETRQFIQDNFVMVFKKNENIPVGIIVEPYLKRLQVLDVPLEIFDYDFISTISQYPLLGLKQGIQIIDLVGKFYLNDPVFAKVSGVPFTQIASRFISQGPMQDYLFMFCQYSLNLTVSTEAKKLKKGKKPLEFEESVQQRNKILDIVYWIIQQWQDALNDKLKIFLIKLINDFKKVNGAEFKGLIILLDLLGDSESILKEIRDNEPAEEVKVVPEQNMENYQLTPVFESISLRKIKGFPWERINNDIEKAKKKKIERDIKIKEEEEKTQKALDFKKKKLKKQLEVRKLEQGVGKDEVSTLVYKEGIVQKYITQEEIILRIFTAEESDLEEGVNLMMSKYSRVFKLLFFKYSGTGFEKKNHAKSDFDQHRERKSKLNDAEYIKLLKDFTVIPKLLTKEELKGIMRTYNFKVAKQAEQWFVDYKSFKGVFTQIAFFVYSRRPNDYSHLPPIVSLKFLLNFMRDYLASQGKSTEIFDEPDPGTGDKDFVRTLNKALQKDPKTVIPEGYEKITDKEVQVYFSIPEAARVPYSTKISVEILDDVLFKSIGIRFLEPQIVQTVSYRVKGKPAKKEVITQPPIYERVSETIKPKNKAEKLSEPEKILKKNVAKSSALIKPEFKLEKPKINPTPDKSTKFLALQDKIEKIRKNDREEVDKFKADDERRRNARQQDLLEELRNAKEARQRLLREEDERKKNQEVIDNIKRRVAEEKMKKAKEDRKKLLESWANRKQEEAKSKEQENFIKKKISEDMQRFEEARKRNQQRLMEELKNRENKVLQMKKEETNKLKKMIKEKEAKKAIGLQHYMENKIKEQNQKSDSKREFLMLINNNEIKRYIEKYNDQIGDIFAFYLLKMKTELTSETSINMNNFNKFCQDFLVNEITPVEQCNNIFNFLTKKKSSAIINYEEFTKAIILIANVGKDKLDVEESGVKPVAKFLDYTEISINLKDLKKKLNKIIDPNEKPKPRKRPLSLINAPKNLMSKKPEFNNKKEMNKSFRKEQSSGSSRSRRSSSDEY